MDNPVVKKKAGTIRRISVQNFMCHSSLTIDLGKRVNFITGQNGSGKSAILTALCVAFGISAKGTQRASSMKDFIKTGCRQATVIVELSNEGDDAFKPAVFGDTVIVERRIVDNRTTFCIKDNKRQKVGTKKEDVMEIVEHFNIDVDNPCVIMTQDKSREFLHTGSEKDKFKFFFRATLLQEVHDLLQQWQGTQEQTRFIIDELEKEQDDIKAELSQLQGRLETLEKVEGFRLDIAKLERLFIWAEVKDKEDDLEEAEAELAQLKERIPICQAKIDQAQMEVDQKREVQSQKISFVDNLTISIRGLKESKAQLESEYEKACNEKARANTITVNAKRSLAKNKAELREYTRANDEMMQQMLQDRQGEKDAKLAQIAAAEEEHKVAEQGVQLLQDEERVLRSELDAFVPQKSVLAREIDDLKSQLKDLERLVRELQSQQTNSVTAFGGDSVLRLLREIENNQARFTRPPLGPIGAHVGLIHGSWALALEVAVGQMLNNFVVTNQRDGLLLRELGKRAGYHNLNFSIQSFDRPPIRPTEDDVPDAALWTVLASLQCDEPTIMNVLIDQGRVEQKVLVENYDEGKHIAFDGRYRNVAEVILKDGTRLFERAGAETILPLDRRTRRGRLGVRVDEQILQTQAQERVLRTEIREVESRKRKLDEESVTFNSRIQGVRKRRVTMEKDLRAQESTLKDLKREFSFEFEGEQGYRGMELDKEIEATQEEMALNESAVQDSEVQLGEATRVWDDTKSRLEQFTDSARGDLKALEAAEGEVADLGQDLNASEGTLAHWTKLMREKVLKDIQVQNALVEETRNKLEKTIADVKNAYPEQERPAAEEMRLKRAELSRRIKALKETVKREENRDEPIEHLKKRESKLRKKISSKEKWFANLRWKLNMLQDKLDERKGLYRHNCVNFRRELTWGFNQHMGRKGFSGTVNVDYGSQALSLSVQMPQDASNTAVKDTRALSGGERSYSTLAFTLAVHGMIEAPFRAMDEFDVFMDAISRKISLDSLVEYAVQEGSQWIFITPHDISMVKGTEFVKKQEMPAPRE